MLPDSCLGRSRGTGELLTAPTLVGIAVLLGELLESCEDCAVVVSQCCGLLFVFLGVILKWQCSKGVRNKYTFGAQGSH